MGRNGGGGGGYVFPAEEEGVIGVSLAKKPAESRTWMLVDATGQEKTLEVDKYTIMRRVQIHARDLRIIDPFLSYPSAILGREKAIVLNLEHIKAIITAEEVWLQDPFNERLIPFLEQLRRQFKTVHSGGEADGNEHHGENAEEDELTFEFKALEVALEAICSYLAARSVELELSIYPALDMLTSKISSKNLERLRKLKSKMTRLTARVQKVRDELEQLLDDDEDMADLYLSRKIASEASCMSESGAANSYAHSPTIGSRISGAGRVSMATFHDDENDVEELEMLLEAYFTQIDDTLNKLSTIREYVESTEDYINIQLDNHRNQLIQLELGLNLGTVCLAIYSLVAAIFGMNIPYTWNDNHGFMFKWVVSVAGVFSGLLFVSIIYYARHKGLIRFGL